jgi:hypothetical protein
VITKSLSGYRTFFCPNNDEMNWTNCLSMPSFFPLGITVNVAYYFFCRLQ